MAKLEQTFYGDFDDLLNRIEEGIQRGSSSASLEDVRVFERYSWSGGNRVSMNVTLFQAGNGPIQLSAITSGGSQAMFFKVNTLGEESFLDKLRELL